MIAMKHLFSLAAALGVGVVALLCACQREDRPFQDGLCTLRVCASVPTPTRVTGVTQEAESRISSLQVFVFDERGELETSAAFGIFFTASASCAFTRGQWW